MLDGSKLPADPWLAWGLLILSFLGPIVVAYLTRVKDKPKTDPPQPAAPAQQAAQPPSRNLGPQDEMLVELVRGLERRAIDAEAQRERERKEHEAERKEREAETTALRHRVRELESEVIRLNDRIDTLLRQR